MVAIPQAIVRPTTVFLLDKPLSNIDAELRTSIRVELKGIERKLGITIIYVARDQVGAMNKTANLTRWEGKRFFTFCLISVGFVY